MPQRLNCLRQRPHRSTWPDPVGDVIRADHDRTDVRRAGDSERNLPLKVGGPRPHEGDGLEENRSLRQLRQPRREKGAERLFRYDGAVPRGARVAQHGEPKRRPPKAGAVEPARVRRRTDGITDPTPGHRGLGAQNAVKGPAHEPDAAAAERGSGGKSARCGCLAHVNPQEIRGSILLSGATPTVHPSPNVWAHVRDCRRSGTDASRAPGRSLGWLSGLRELPSRPRRQHSPASARQGDRRRSGHGAGEGRVHEPGWLREGPDRPADGGGGRGERGAEAGGNDRRTDVGKHRRRPRHGRPGQGLPVHLRLP